MKAIIALPNVTFIWAKMRHLNTPHVSIPAGGGDLYSSFNKGKWENYDWIHTVNMAVFAYQFHTTHAHHNWFIVQ